MSLKTTVSAEYNKVHTAHIVMMQLEKQMYSFSISLRWSYGVPMKIFTHIHRPVIFHENATNVRKINGLKNSVCDKWRRQDKEASRDKYRKEAKIMSWYDYKIISSCWLYGSDWSLFSTVSKKCIQNSLKQSQNCIKCTWHTFFTAHP